MKHHGICLDLEMVDFDYHQDPTPQHRVYHLEPQTFKHVDNINVSDKPTYDTSLESPLTGDSRIWQNKHDRTPSAETIRTQTSNP